MRDLIRSMMRQAAASLDAVTRAAAAQLDEPMASVFRQGDVCSARLGADPAPAGPPPSPPSPITPPHRRHPRCLPCLSRPWTVAA